MIKMKKINYIYWVFSGSFYWDWKSLTTKDKISWVWFYDYSRIIWDIISYLSPSEFDVLRLHIYQDFKHNINFIKSVWIENFADWKDWVVDWFRVSSWIFYIPLSLFATYLPKSVRKSFLIMINFMKNMF